MIQWVKELQVRVKKIRQHLIKLVGDVENIPIIGVRDSARAVDLEGLPNYANQDGGIDIGPLMVKRVFTDKRTSLI